MSDLSPTLWQECHSALQDMLSSDDFNMWLKPLQADYVGESTVILYVANTFVKQRIETNYLPMITTLCREISHKDNLIVEVKVGEKRTTPAKMVKKDHENEEISANGTLKIKSNLNPNYLFENFVEGKCNQYAKAAGDRVALNPGDKMSNPLFLYGSTGLGKTHLLHAIGNRIVQNNTKARVVYLSAEMFTRLYIKALTDKRITDFKDFYRNVDVLLIDDIQFFARKESTQEEFFHTFNSLVESNHQIILASDRYPKEIERIDERLKSRFGWGLSIPIEPPDLETRVAILLKKAEDRNFDLPMEVADFIGKRLRTNVRELEGALNRVQANAEFTGKGVTIEFVRDVLRDLLVLQDKLITVENIQKVVADYYRIKVSDLKSKSRKRTITRPRQLAMALSKELTNLSLPEIGREFDGKDHTTVLHACKKIAELCEEDVELKEDWTNLVRTLSV